VKSIILIPQKPKIKQNHFAGSRENRDNVTIPIEALSAPTSPNVETPLKVTTTTGAIGRNPLRGSKCKDPHNFSFLSFLL